MPHIRKCHECGNPTLMPISRQMSVYSTSVRYKCDECDFEIDITPTGSIGVLSTVCILVLGFWWMILFRNTANNDLITIIVYGIAVLAFGFVTIVPALAHLLYPKVKSKPDVELQTNNADKHIAKGLIIWIEGLGFLAGLLAPLLLIAVVLFIAFLIGYVNFTYFGN